MELTIPAALASAARQFGDAPALAEPGGPRLSYGELHDRAAIVSRALIAEGVAPGDRVAVWAPNTHHWVLAALGALGAGATLVPVSTRFTGPEALDVIGRSGARALVVAGRFLGTDRLAELRTALSSPDQAADPAAAGLKLGLVVRIPVEPEPEPEPAPAVAAGHPPEFGRVLDWAEFEQAADRVPAGVAAACAAAVRPEQVSDIMFTSGTTGRSKGAMSAHRQALAVARAWAECGALTSADRYLVVNPFFHNFGFKAGILACL
ncbi:MAG: AMP-binding protein, partial [Streptosporangiaceae bacterium]